MKAEEAENSEHVFFDAPARLADEAHATDDEIGLAGTTEQAVIRYARLAQAAGLQGVVASPLEVTAIKAACGDGFVTVTPGIRPAGADVGDQSRIMTPAEAFAQGTDYVVIGRPITGAADPRAAIEAIIDSIV